MVNTKTFIYPLCLLLIINVSCAPNLYNTKTEALPLPKQFPEVPASPQFEPLGGADSSNPAALVGPVNPTQEVKAPAKDLSADAPPQISPQIVWKEFFKQNDIQGLIDTALKNNQELRVLEQEIMIANNEILFRQGEYWPKPRLGAEAGIEKTERFSTPDANDPVQFSKFGLFASWEVDIWKKLRNATKSAYYSFLSSIEGRRFAVTHLISEVGNTYFELRALQKQLEIVEEYTKVIGQIRLMSEYQVLAAKSTALATKRFEAEVYKNQSRQFKIRQDIVQARNRLNTLLGRYPQDIIPSENDWFEMKLPMTATTVPAKLLENRPDIKQASFELEAAKLSVDVARARFYPALTIDAGVGYEQFNSKHFENPVNSVFYNAIAGLTAPILNRKGIRADYYTANNKQIQSIYRYEQALIRGYTDVVNQLNLLKNVSDAFTLKEKQVEALNQAVEFSNLLFKAARFDYIETLLTQRDRLEAQLELIELKKQQFSAQINLYQALGGGWRSTDAKVESNY